MNFKSIAGDAKLIKDIGGKLTDLQAILLNEYGFPCRIVFMGYEVNNNESFNNLKSLGPKNNFATVIPMKICPTCTLYNIITRTECEVCRTSLKDGNKNRKSRKIKSH